MCLMYTLYFHYFWLCYGDFNFLMFAFAQFLCLEDKRKKIISGYSSTFVTGWENNKFWQIFLTKTIHITMIVNWNRCDMRLFTLVVTTTDAVWVTSSFLFVSWQWRIKLNLLELDVTNQTLISLVLHIFVRNNFKKFTHNVYHINIKR